MIFSHACSFTSIVYNQSHAISYPGVLNACIGLMTLGASGDLVSFTPDAASIASSIKYHAEFTPAFSPEKFELPKAFFATAQSVRDALIINWNATYDYYEKKNVKQAYYLSMEFLQVCQQSCKWLFLNKMYI